MTDDRAVGVNVEMWKCEDVGIAHGIRITDDGWQMTDDRGG